MGTPVLILIDVKVAAKLEVCVLNGEMKRKPANIFGDIYILNFG